MQIVDEASDFIDVSKRSWPALTGPVVESTDVIRLSTQ
jgi:hypothetical protein